MSLTPLRARVETYSSRVHWRVVLVSSLLLPWNITISQSLSPGATCISTTPVGLHYTRFASFCQNSFNFDNLSYYYKWHNHAVYAVYTKSAKLFLNHRKSTYLLGFMHFFRKFLPNLFLPLQFQAESLWYFPYNEACFSLLLGIKTQQIVKGRKNDNLIHRPWIKLLFYFFHGQKLTKTRKNILDRKNLPKSRTPMSGYTDDNPADGKSITRKNEDILSSRISFRIHGPHPFQKYLSNLQYVFFIIEKFTY